MSQGSSRSDSSDELERLRAQLARSEARLTEVQRLANFGCWERDIAGDRLWWSDAVWDILGLKPDAPVVKFPESLKFVHPDDRPLAEQAYRNAMGSGTPVRFECRIVRPDGTERVVSVAGDGMVGPGGTVTRLIGTVQDITERKRLEHELFESESRCRSIFERAPLGIAVVGTDGRFTQVNPAWTSMIGYSAEELAQMNGIDVTHPDDRAETLRIRAILNAGNLEEFSLDKRYLRRNGEVFWGRAVGATLRDEQGVVTGRVVIIEDISEEREAERRLAERRRQQRDAVVREVHHRIKNHLQGVAGLLERRAAANPALEPAIEEVLGQMNVLAMVHGLHSELFGRELNLCNIARSIVDSQQAVSPVGLEFAVPEGFDPVQVNADEAVPIALILNELVSNALKHRAPSAMQAAVKVEMKRDSAGAAVCVRNAPASLPPGFDFADDRTLGTGLRLAKSLLPADGARLSFSQPAAGVVEAVLDLWPPVLNHATHGVSEA